MSQGAIYEGIAGHVHIARTGKVVGVVLDSVPRSERDRRAARNIQGIVRYGTATAECQGALTECGTARVGAGRLQQIRPRTVEVQATNPSELGGECDGFTSVGYDRGDARAGGVGQVHSRQVGGGPGPISAAGENGAQAPLAGGVLIHVYGTEVPAGEVDGFDLRGVVGAADDAAVPNVDVTAANVENPRPSVVLVADRNPLSVERAAADIGYAGAGAEHDS